MRIYADQIGYLPDAEKIAVFAIDPNDGATVQKPCELKLIRAGDGSEVTGVPVKILPAQPDDTAGETVGQADFSSLKEPGEYLLRAADGSASQIFAVRPHVYRDVKNAMIRALYFQRCGCELPEKFAGVYRRPVCHTDDAILFEDRAIKLQVSGGWHDAGDFGRYPSAAATALGHLLYAYELFPDRFTETTGIPETGNGLPDLLNECLYELRFLLRMQNGEGGVYHKVTTMRHAEFIMPQDDHGELFVFPVSSMSTASFAAVMCIASRVYEDLVPEFSREAVHAAAAAGQWLLAHPGNTGFRNPEGCNTGEYGDKDDTDERLWAFAELLRTDREMRHEGDRSHEAAMPLRETRQEKYRRAFASLWEKKLAAEKEALAAYDGALASGSPVSSFDPILLDGFGWEDVTAFAQMSVLTDPDRTVGGEVYSEMRDLLLRKTERMLREQERSGFRLAMLPRDFVWGSNMVVTNRADLLILAALIDPEQAVVYEAAALEQLHYLFGRNASDVSYVTGFGGRAFRRPHNRVTVADGVDDPIPGEVSGGPCFPPRDPMGQKLVPAGSAPQKCYADHEDSYSLNEITIYWNSSAIFATAYFDR
ncbi:MAG: glycoside hydrolase family 9 protein [Lachnospiraceae bacterium]|nr:glycoside hydrolase family 9 protein [Lachnospiraceae bacterium]